MATLVDRFLDWWERRNYPEDKAMEKRIEELGKKISKATIQSQSENSPPKKFPLSNKL
jgi:hypothetical protein